MSNFDEDEFNRIYLGKFKTDEKLIAIDEKLKDYYDSTDDCGNREAMQHWRKFSEWCRYSGYSNDDINAAKRRCSNHRGIKNANNNP